MKTSMKSASVPGIQYPEPVNSRRWLCGLLLFAGCGAKNGERAAGSAVTDGESPGDAAMSPDLQRPFVDDDHDGLDDTRELALATDYLPYLSISPSDGCDTMGLLVRVTPHKDDPRRIHIIYDQLYDLDCGAGGHHGDDEVFAVTVDPSLPAPAGIIAMIAISHQGTPCQRISACGHCPGQKPCDTLLRGGVAWPAVWPSKAKHGSYVNRAQSCQLLNTCFDQCDDNAMPRKPPIVNAGEPGQPLVRDLTTNGFVTAANGWKNMELFHFDPWGGTKFGGAGSVTGDLMDPAFDTPSCP